MIMTGLKSLKVLFRIGPMNCCRCRESIDVITNSIDNENEATLSCDIARLLSGDYPVLFAHPESFDTKLGQFILRELQKRGMLLLICIDEFHQGGEGHWSSFRPEMLRGTSHFDKPKVVSRSQNQKLTT